jgi:hypothetical protein
VSFYPPSTAFFGADFSRFIFAHVDIGHAAKTHRLAGVKAALPKVLWLHIADVEKAIAPDPEIDEGGLDARLQVDDASLIDIADVVIRAGAFDVKFFEQPVFNNGDPAFLRLRHID